MNTLEEQIELGSMVQERRRIKSRLDCTKNKLNKYRQKFVQFIKPILKVPIIL